MPVEVLSRTMYCKGFQQTSRLSSFGFSGTIAHGAFDIQQPVVANKVLASSDVSIYRARTICQELHMKHFGRVAVARRSRMEVCNGTEAKSATYCREHIFTLVDYSCRTQTTLDLSGSSGTSSTKTDLIEAPSKLRDRACSWASIGLNCNRSDGKLRSVIYPEPRYAPFPQASSSKLNLPGGFHQPQGSLVMMTGESNLGSHNFSNQVKRISSVEAGARAVGGSVLSIELPLITESMKQ